MQQLGLGRQALDRGGAGRKKKDEDYDAAMQEQRTREVLVSGGRSWHEDGKSLAVVGRIERKLNFAVEHWPGCSGLD